MPLIADHRFLSQDNLSDSAANIAFYLGQVATPGQFAGGLKSGTVAASAGINNVETLIGSIAVQPGVTLAAGTIIRATIQGTETNTVANTSTFGLRMGILGTVSDAAIATWVTPASGSTGTNIPFTAVITVTIRTLGAAGTAYGVMVVNSVTAGILGAAITFNVQSATNPITAVPTTTASFIDFTAVTAATTTTNTIQSCIIEVIP